MSQQGPRSPHLGKLITRLTRSLVAVKDWDMEFTMDFVGRRTNYSPDTVYRWQQGRVRPRSETIEMLIQIGKEEANLDREWGESLLHAAQHPDTVAILNKLWGPKESRSIPCNLPTAEHSALIGRQHEIADLLDLLSDQYPAHLISVDGIGGVGKTALVMEAAYRCLRNSTSDVRNSQIPTFDAIIFVSAKQRYLTPSGLLSSTEAQRTLRDIFREVAQTLNRFEIIQATPQDQLARVRDALSRQRTLLIVDNLETMEEKQEIVAFLYRLPHQAKVVITTRERALFSPIRLEQLEEEDAVNLMKKEAQKKGVELSEEQALTLYQRIGGIPAALVYSIGQIASGYSLKTVLNKVLNANGDVPHFCFEESISPLRERPAHKLLMAMAMFSKHPVREAIAHVAGLTADANAVEDGLAQLLQLSLISQHGGRYHMLPLTREYALTELSTHPEFEWEARRRWVEWYMNFTNQYGGYDWTEWHIQFDRIEEEWENLLAVFDWCAANEAYYAIRSFWHSGGVLKVAYIYGYWDDLLIWLNWLTQAAERRGDWSIAVSAMMEVGSILSHMGRLEDADRFLRRAWDLREHADFRIQVEIIQIIARLRTYQEQYAEAQYWLDQANAFLEKAQLHEPEYSRKWINNQRYYGELCYKKRDYDQAEMCFRQVLDRAQMIGRQRSIIASQNYLANIAIAQDRLVEAEGLLKTGLTVCERNKDKRRTAYYKCSFAHLYRKLDDLGASRRWAEEAFDGFERLGMQLEMEEMRALLQELQD